MTSYFTTGTWPNIATMSRTTNNSGNTTSTWSLRSGISTAPWCSSSGTSTMLMASKLTRGRSRPSVTGPNHSRLRNSNDSSDSPTSIADLFRTSVSSPLPSLPCSARSPSPCLGILKLGPPSRSSRRPSAMLPSHPVFCGSGRLHHRNGSSAVPTPWRASLSPSLFFLLQEAFPGGEHNYNIGNCSLSNWLWRSGITGWREHSIPSP